MAPSAELLLDTSAAVPLLLRSHEAHASTLRALGKRGPLGLSGHAAFETYSVLTRLPGRSRVSPATARTLISHNFPATRHLSGRATQRLLAEVSAAGIAGGAVYDALVAAAAREHGVALATRDTRAAETYRALGIEVLSL